VAATDISVGPDGVARCWWADSDDLYRRYHDQEWGRPVADDRLLFEKLTLEGFMSGLSWLTILRKRENFRRAFRDFEPRVVARFGARDAARLMRDEGIVRNRAKIDATINNARRYPELVKEFGSFAAYAWRFAPPPRKKLIDRDELMRIKYSAEALALSKELRKRGWAFVGPTTVYSFMEAMGLVNDHLRGCAAGTEVQRLEREFVRPPT
jgi:DNA-3-methyladenine glycosylase I